MQGVVTLLLFHSYHQTLVPTGRQKARLEAGGGILHSVPGDSDPHPQKSGLLFLWLPLGQDTMLRPLSFPHLFLRLEFCT